MTGAAILEHSPWRVIGDTRDRVGESPVWDEQAQALYWVDIEGRCIRRLDVATGAVQSWDTPQRPGCLALTSRGSLMVAMETGVFEVELLDPPQIRTRLVAAVTHRAPGMRFNDGRCDAQGRFWLGTMVMDMSLALPAGALYVLDENGLGEPVVDAMITPNGLAFGVDGRVAYHSDSHPSVQQIWAFDVDPTTGRMSGRRPWVDMRPLPGRPDGGAVDAAGFYWICANDAGLIHRFAPDGQLVASLEVPVPKPAMCAFGGPDLNTLYVTSIQPAGAEPGLSGALFACELNVRGRFEPRFSRFPTRPDQPATFSPNPVTPGDKP